MDVDETTEPPVAVATVDTDEEGSDAGVKCSIATMRLDRTSGESGGGGGGCDAGEVWGGEEFQDFLDAICDDRRRDSGVSVSSDAASTTTATTAHPSGNYCSAPPPNLLLRTPHCSFLGYPC